MEEKVISNFRGKYYFLSNFYSAPIFYDGLSFLNNEAAFQSCKCANGMKRKDFCMLPPNEAKALGRKVGLRYDWEQVKDGIMLKVVRAKFKQNPDLANRLLATGKARLIEGNDWGDNYWGISPYSNDNPEMPWNNHLGKILMMVREELKDRK